MAFLRKVWHRWKQFGQLIGDFVARLVLTLFYFTVLAPFGLGVRWRSDPLQLRPRTASWRRHKAAKPTMEEGRRLG
jgi:hypothetical protein